MTDLLTALTALSPLGLAGLLGYIIYLMTIQRRTVHQLGSNHLAEIAETLRRLETRIGVMADHITWIRAKLNGD